MMQDKLNMIVAYVQSRLATMKKDEGATAVEYGLLVTFIALAMIVGVTAFGGRLSAFFSFLVGKLPIT